MYICILLCLYLYTQIYRYRDINHAKKMSYAFPWVPSNLKRNGMSGCNNKNKGPIGSVQSKGKRRSRIVGKEKRDTSLMNIICVPRR